MAAEKNTLATVTPKDKQIETTEQSHIQIPGGAYVFFQGNYNLPQYVPVSYDVYRQMAKLPTISLVRSVILAEVTQTPYEFSAAEDDGAGEDVVKATQSAIEPLLDSIIRNATLGMVDYGWQPFEVCWAPDFTPVKAKSLLPDMTWVLLGGAVKDKTVSGDHVGLRQGNIQIFAPDYLLFSFRPEGSMWYGRCMLEGLRPTFMSYAKLWEAQERYYSKVAGAHWVVWHPKGMSLNKDGSLIDNALIADQILRNIESNGRMRFEQPSSEIIQQFNADPKWIGWRIEMIESQQKGEDYVVMLAHQEKQFCRGLGFPERAILEAQNSGSRADSESHGDYAQDISLEITSNIFNTINTQLIDPWLEFHYGPDAVGSVKLQPMKEEEEDAAVVAGAAGQAQAAQTEEEKQAALKAGVTAGSEK